jgi:hypothetical protein
LTDGADAARSTVDRRHWERDERVWFTLNCRWACFLP